MKIGFIGIGAMGKPMARNILRAGYKLTVTDVNKDAVAELVAEGAIEAATPKEVAQKSDVIITMLPNGVIVEGVFSGPEGIVAGAQTGLTIIDMSSVAPGFTRKMAKLAMAKGINYFDAPVSGGVKGATEGTLTIMLGGKSEMIESYRPLLEVMGTKLYHVGDVGSGDAVKIVNNLLLAANMAAAAEAFTLGIKMGLDPETLYDVISVSSGNSYAMTAKMPNFVFKRNFKPGFAIDLQYKDVELATQSAKEEKLPMPLTNLVQQIFEQARAAGLGGEDISAVIKPMEQLAGIEVKK